MSAVTDRDLGFEEVLRALTGLEDGIAVYGGIRQQEGVKPAGERQADGTVTDSKSATIAEIATYQEFGAVIKTGPAAGTIIPERSFLRATLAEHEQDYVSALAKDLGLVIDGKEQPEAVFRKLGARFVRDAQMRIRKGIEPANAPSTIKRKKSSKPLIDTGRLRQSIDYEVKRGEK